MLSYPDRETFEQIRARWEGAQLEPDTSSEMLGRKEKHAPAEPVNSEPLANSGSKIRRKLSHFISNPLSQRKSASKCHQVILSTRALSQPKTVQDVSGTNAYNASLSSECGESSFECSNSLSNTSKASVNSTYHTTSSRPLPRSRTLSFIPRPIRVESQLSATDAEGLVKTETATLTTNSTVRIPSSKIPTPSPPLDKDRHPILSRHASCQLSQPGRHNTSTRLLAGKRDSRPPKFPVRAHTTPNLVMEASLQRLENSNSPIQTTQKKFLASSIVGNRALQENTPLNRLGPQRTLGQEKIFKETLLAKPTAVTKRMSFGPESSHTLIRHPHLTSTPTRRKRFTSQPVQRTPVTARRLEPKELVDSHPCVPHHVGKSDSVAQLRLLGPRNPPTPAPYSNSPQKQALPHFSTDKNSQRNAFGVSNGLDSVWISSRTLAMTNDKVRSIPRSSTFHNFGLRRETPVPVPPIPEQYRTPSSSFLAQHPEIYPDNLVISHPTRMTSNAALCGSIPEATSKAEDMHGAGTASRQEDRECRLGKCSVRTINPKLSPLMFPAFSLPIKQEPEPIERPVNYQKHDAWIQRRSLSENKYLESADNESMLQVKDYMPPLYWAGRFQSRFDQWRTEAMRAELNSSYTTNATVIDCKLNQEQLATCYIFAQLRALCTTGQAAESLCVSTISVSHSFI